MVCGHEWVVGWGGISMSIHQSLASAARKKLSGWNLAGASYASKSHDASGQDGNFYGLAFRDDGTKMYLVGDDNDSVFQYSLSTAWDVSTASYDSVSYDFSSEQTLPRDIAFRDNGTKMYILGISGSGDPVSQYSLSTAWDVSTASYDSVNEPSGDTAAQGLAFSADGTKMYVSGNTGEDVQQFNLSTAWDLSTASAGSAFSVISQTDEPSALGFKSDGTRMFLLDNQNNKVHQYSLSTAWDISTASYDSVEFSVASQETSPQGIAFRDDGTNMYVVGRTNDDVFQYNL